MKGYCDIDLHKKPLGFPVFFGMAQGIDGIDGIDIAAM